MDAPVKGNVRNQSMDCCKLLGAIFVVFIHVPLPGSLGMVLSTMGRFAVPIFFAISGYYSYRIGERKLKKRFAHILWLNVAATGVMLLWDCTDAWLKGEYVLYYLRKRLTLSPEELVRWAVLQINPFGGHLWYLTAVLLCYGALWLYHRLYREKEVNYTPLYILSAGLLLFNVAVGEIARGMGLQISNKLVRNFWFFGLPMFTMGLFIRQYQNKLFSYCRQKSWILAALVLLGEGLSILQRFTMGSWDFPVGMLLTAPALMLLIASYPTLTNHPGATKVISLFGDMATWIYILHLVFLAVYENHLGIYIHHLLPNMITLFTVGASFISALVLQILIHTVKTLTKR